MRLRSSLAGRLMAVGFWIVSSAGARADEVDEFVAKQMDRQHIPGLSLAVLRDGKPVKVQGYGVANIETNMRASPETVYQIGSVSKQFIAAGILRLNEDGKVGLDDSLRKYLVDAPEAWQAITLRQLLTHTSGLVRETPDLQLKAQSDIDAIRAAYSLPLTSAPGEKWAYSNLGYFALAEVISRASQMPWPRYLQQRVFAPLGMSATRTTSMDEIIPQRASGYHWMEQNEYRNAPSLPGVRPSGAFLSSVVDMIKWDEALRSERAFSPQQRALMWTPVKLNDGSEKPYGFGWELGKTGTHAVAKHSGTMLGFRAHILRLTEERLTVVVLTNATQAMPEKIALGVAACYVPDLKLPPGKRTVTKAPTEVLARYSGRYRLTGGRTLVVAQRGENLLVSMPLTLPGVGKELAQLVQGVSMELAFLTAESETRFFDLDDPRSTYVFSTDAQGRQQLAIEDQNGKLGQPALRVDADAGVRSKGP